MALDILGATGMPHSLYVHSGVVQTSQYGRTVPEKREALTFATIHAIAEEVAKGERDLQTIYKAENDEYLKAMQRMQ